MGLEESVFYCIAPKDKKTLRRWLFLLELGCIVGSIAFVIFLVLFLVEKDFLWSVKFGLVSLISLICTSFLVVFQYMLLVEWNTRKKINK